MSWTQPVCRACFDRMRPDQEPARVKNNGWMVCCTCGERTDEGIFMRLNPDEVPYPRVTED